MVDKNFVIHAESILVETIDVLCFFNRDLYSHHGDKAYSNHFRYFMYSLDGLKRRLREVNFRYDLHDYGYGTQGHYQDKLISLYRKTMRVIHHTLTNRYFNEAHRNIIEAMYDQLNSIYMFYHITKGY